MCKVQCRVMRVKGNFNNILLHFLTGAALFDLGLHDSYTCKHDTKRGDNLCKTWQTPSDAFHIQPYSDNQFHCLKSNTWQNEQTCSRLFCQSSADTKDWNNRTNRLIVGMTHHKPFPKTCVILTADRNTSPSSGRQLCFLSKTKNQEPCFFGGLFLRCLSVIGYFVVGVENWEGVQVLWRLLLVC